MSSTLQLSDSISPQDGTKLMTTSSFMFFFLWRAPQRMLRTHRSLRAYCATLWWRWLVPFIFPCNWAPVEWNWQGKTEVLEEKPVPVPLCPPQIPHRLTQDRTQPSAVRGWRLTAWAMARPLALFYLIWYMRPKQRIIFISRKLFHHSISVFKEYLIRIWSESFGLCKHVVG
jgi:hypothetical protein